MRSDGVWIIVPARAFGAGKTRLAPVLDAEGRRRFSRECFRRVVSVARRAVGPDNVLVVTRDAEVQGLARRIGARRLLERGRGLNTAVAQAVVHASRLGARGVLILHSDLPRLDVRDVRRLLQAMQRQAGVVLGPDRDCDGTNALGLRPIARFAFHYGPGSFTAHRKEARGRRTHFRIVAGERIQADVDTPAQYNAWKGAVRSEP
jgi:2-phospho-L-lactate guanylyltransferase